MAHPPIEWQESATYSKDAAQGGKGGTVGGIFAPHVVGPASRFILQSVARATADRNRGHRRGHVANSVTRRKPAASISIVGPPMSVVVSVIVASPDHIRVFGRF